MKVKRILSFCLLLTMMLSILPVSVYASNPFNDVKEGDYFYAPVTWAVEQGITMGVSSTSFAPEDFCTRAQIVTFLWRAKGKPEPQGLQNPFTDVKTTDYFYKAVLWAVEQGITVGVSATSFAPEESCTRAQAATFLYRSEGNSEVVELSSPFADVKSGVYYYNAVLWAVKNEITNGTSNTTFSPEDTCTRAQIVAFLYRCYRNSADDYILKIDNSTLALEVGEYTILKYTYTGTKSLTWKSNNSGIATVDSNGKVTAKSAGTAVITLTDGVKNSQCVVTVKEADYNLSLSNTSLTLNIGESKTLGYTYTGTKSLSWKSSNTAVATVSNGVVTAKGAGTATITLTDGNKSATCNVTVTTPPPAGSIVIHTPRDTVVYVGETLQLDYTYTGDKSKLSFVSDDTSILTITNSGLVTGVSEGSCYVFAYCNGGEIGYVRLLVKERSPVAKSIEVYSETGPYFNGVAGVAGNYMQFATFALTADRYALRVAASSSNPSVADVTFKSADNTNMCWFRINFKSAGSTTITITSEDGNVSKSYTINVKGGYNCNPGKNQLTPEEFAYYATQVMVENGATADCTGGYRVLTLTDSDLTWYNAYTCGEAWVREFWPNGLRYMGLAYQGVNEDGKHVFYIHR